ncbi:SARP family transcriptional regulator [Nonomuraea phyllanthi]|uniref:SARP family transcriptional regulator n=1 Tax=Nonomuraea phyllanthi TaxID=2219224 RepID=A0A5C4WNT7_9ACTN|nr:BTAD domain-containing putative transcriptional regulator [Nonomuraea phyllanthi]KAB8195303.1 SARP family transcriptional regulator [Nonomuraea phyllanthi]
MVESSRRPFRVALLGGFRLLAAGEQLTVSSGSERLLAYLAISRRTVPRGVMAATLWPDAPEKRAHANLRSALARLDGAGRRVLDVGATEIGLSPETAVDVDEARSLARCLLDPAAGPGEVDAGARSVELLSDGLLPGWYEEWVLAAADEWHQLRLHALEALSALLVRQGRHAEAVTAASVATHADPLRESACAALIEAHLAEGNQAEALRHFQLYEHNLHAELGLRPTSRLCELVEGLRPARDR